MYDSKTERTYSDIDLTYRLVAAGVDRAQNWENFRLNFGAHGSWNKTESERTVMPAGYHVGGAEADNLSGSQGQFLFEPPTGPVLVQPIDRPPIFRSTQPILMKRCVSG